MIEFIQIVFIASILAVSYQILIMPGELLQSWSRFVNINMQGSILQKLLLCPYCVGGQISLWCSVACIIKGYGVECLASVPTTIVVVYFVVKNNFK